MPKAAHIVAGMAFGDEGKGATVDFLCRLLGAKLVVRFNGGPQAAHTVVLPDGRFHMFSQFGSGTFAGADTHLSRFMLVSPKAMMDEERIIRETFGVTDLWKRLTVEDQCVVITPFHQAVNRILEWTRGNGRHGSCGLGVGQARSNHLEYGESVLFAADVKYEKVAKEKLKFLQSVAYKSVAPLLTKKLPHDLEARELLTESDAIDWAWQMMKDWPAKIVGAHYLHNVLDLRYKEVVFEGAQGVLLDEKYGTAPHNTWTNCTFENAESLLWNFCGDVYKIGCFRTYFTRHGAGPFPTEDPLLGFPELHNSAGVYQGAFRLGRFDWSNARYAVNVAKPTEISLSHLDCVFPDSAAFVQQLEGFLGLPVTIAGRGPIYHNRVYRERGVSWQAKRQTHSSSMSRFP